MTLICELLPGHLQEVQSGRGCTERSSGILTILGLQIRVVFLHFLSFPVSFGFILQLEHLHEARLSGPLAPELGLETMMQEIQA